MGTRCSCWSTPKDLRVTRASAPASIARCHNSPSSLPALRYHRGVADFQPSRDEFLRLAREYTLVPVWREVLGDLETPVGVYRKLGGEPNSFLLESVEHGERWGRYSFIGVEPFLTMASRGGVLEWTGDPPAGVAGAADPLVALERAVSAYRAPSLPGLPPLHGGAVG